MRIKAGLRTLLASSGETVRFARGVDQCVVGAAFLNELPVDLHAHARTVGNRDPAIRIDDFDLADVSLVVVPLETDLRVEESVLKVVDITQGRSQLEVFGSADVRFDVHS